MSKKFLSVGNIVRIKNKRGLKLVIRSEDHVFDVVNLKSPGPSGMLINPKVYSFVLKTSNMNGDGMSVEDVTVIHKCVLETKVTVVYSFKSAESQ